MFNSAPFSAVKIVHEYVMNCSLCGISAEGWSAGGCWWVCAAGCTGQDECSDVGWCGQHRYLSFPKYLSPTWGTGSEQRCSQASPAFSANGQKIHIAAIGSGGQRTDLLHSWKEKCRLFYFHGVSNAAAFPVVFVVFLRWQFSDILGFTPFLMLNVSPWL